jgi:hypothetical protein
MSGLPFMWQSQILGMVSPGLEEPESRPWLENHGSVVSFMLPYRRIRRKNMRAPAELLNETLGFACLKIRASFPVYEL